MTNNELEARVYALEAEVEMLRDHMRRVSICKITDPRYPYWNWLVENHVHPDRQSLAETLLSVFDYRAEGRPIPEFIRKPYPGVDVDRLFAPEPPSRAEVEETLLAALQKNMPAPSS